MECVYEASKETKKIETKTNRIIILVNIRKYGGFLFITKLKGEA